MLVQLLLLLLEVGRVLALLRLLVLDLLAQPVDLSVDDSREFLTLVLERPPGVLLDGIDSLSESSRRGRLT